MSKPIVDTAFDAWVASLPAKHWARYDLSAARLGWDEGRKLLAEEDFVVVPRIITNDMEHAFHNLPARWAFTTSSRWRHMLLHVPGAICPDCEISRLRYVE
jgi:hypothetical protein